MEEDKLLQLLRDKIETALGWKPAIRSDFDTMQKYIYKQTGILLSATTLRRFWGYQEEDKGGGCRISTLNALSVFVGFRSYKDFKQYMLTVNLEDEGSDFIIQCKMLVPEDLTVGAMIHLTWEPGRKVTLRFEGQDVFRVISAEHSKLKPNDTMRCQQFVNGEPLYCKGLIRPGNPTIDYVCGRNGGIRFQLD